MLFPRSAEKVWRDVTVPRQAPAPTKPPRFDQSSPETTGPVPSGSIWCMIGD